LNPISVLPEAKLGELPDLDALTLGIATVLTRSGVACPQLSIVDRSPSLGGTFPSEIVRCRCDDGSELGLFCKYGIGHTTSGDGHRGGVRREAAVYRKVLRSASDSSARFLGTYRDTMSGATWLIIEHLDGAARLNQSPNPDAMNLAAGWIGRFHARTQSLGTHEPSTTTFLPRYDARYYRRWARRTVKASAASSLRARMWLDRVRQGYEDEVTDVLLAQPPTVIHGEYYPKNVLIRESTVYPVDWESAAEAPGEIDLAALTDRWLPALVLDGERAYADARWPHGAPPTFSKTLDAARLYVQFRWLGDPLTQQKQRWRFRELRLVAQRLGLI
jgi:aminoglycoside phosphotransferase (APT) family kinase protein